MNQRRKLKGSKTSWDKFKGKHYLPNLWDAAKIVLRRKFVEINTYIKKHERNIKKQKTITLYLKKLENEERISYKVSRRKEVTEKKWNREQENNRKN